MDLQIQVQKTSNAVVLKLSGKLTSDHARLLGDTIRNQLRTGARSIVLDLSDVTTIDSAGLGELVSAYTTSRNQGGSVQITRLRPRPRDLLERANLSVVLEESDDFKQSQGPWLKKAIFAATILLVVAFLYLALRRN